MRNEARPAAAAFLVLALLAAGPAAAAGFGLYDAQGTQAMGLAGAFVARADDPSAVFYNPAGLAFFEEKSHAAGLSGYLLNESLYQGLPPGIGAGTNGEQEPVFTVVPHAYLTKAAGKKARLGLGINSPFLLDNDWANPDAFAGRFLSLQSEIQTYDLNPVVGWKVGRHLGLGAGLVYRSSSLETLRRFGIANPLGTDPEILDAASFAIDTSFDDGVGWNLGLLYRVPGSFSFGLSYRSAIEVDYDGEGRLTQISTGNTQLDELVAATLPLDQDLGMLTTIEFPDVATLGLALHLGQRILAEIDVSQTGWSSVQQLVFTFPNNSELSETLPLGFEDAMTYRVGVSYRYPNDNVVRLGYAYDESPQPPATAGPFLADASRNVLAIGFGRDWLDLALQYHRLDELTVTNSVVDLNGRYRTDFFLLGITVSR